MGTGESIWTVASTSMIHFRWYFCDNIVDGNRWLPKMAEVQETEVTRLEDHAWLAIHACIMLIEGMLYERDLVRMKIDGEYTNDGMYKKVKTHSL